MTVSEFPLTDEDLVKASLAGRQDSFVQLVRRYQYLVFGLCRHMLGGREDALDATQDTFIAAFRRLSELPRHDEFRAWLRRIASNVCHQRLRARRKTDELLEGTCGADPYRSLDESIDLNLALAGLSPEMRLTVLLFYFEGSSVREIARFLGVPETTVMSRLRNARSQLRRELQIMFDEPTQKSTLPENFADRIPIPYDEYAPHRGSSDPEPLSAWRRDWLLSAYPPGSSIRSTIRQGHDWEAIYDRAVAVDVLKPDGSVEAVSLRMSGRKDGIRQEAALLPVLAELGLPVMRIVAGPSADPDFPERGLLLATTRPSSQSACAWAVEGGIGALDRACEAVLLGIEQVAAATADIEAKVAPDLLERCSLADELARIVEIGGPWMNEPEFADAVRRLEPIVGAIQVRLVFSDSGLGPNALVDSQGKLTGFDSFAWARIEDPLYPITKYWTYDCWPLRQAGFVERYLVRHGLTMRDFAPRLAVRALATLQREIPMRGGDEGYRNDMFGWLRLAMNKL